MPTWIKFCGTTCLEDALASIAAGADALGFIFAPSKRQITPAKAKEIIGKLPKEVERIGVFLNATGEEIREIVSDSGLTGIQLHGQPNETDVYGSLPRGRRESFRIIRTILVKNGFEDELATHLSSQGSISAYLLDASAGSGKTFDWLAARKALGNRKARLIIAGGLNPENVGEAIEIFSPCGVDVVSGIESQPGRKDPRKMRAFVEAVRKAEQR